MTFDRFYVDANVWIDDGSGVSRGVLVSPAQQEAKKC